MKTTSPKKKESLERSAGFLKVQNCNVASRGNRGEKERERKTLSLSSLLLSFIHSSSQQHIAFMSMQCTPGRGFTLRFRTLGIFNELISIHFKKKKKKQAVCVRQSHSHTHTQTHMRTHISGDADERHGGRVIVSLVVLQRTAVRLKLKH